MRATTSRTAAALTVNGKDVALPLPPGESRALGFEFVHQDLGLVPALSVTENLFIGEIANPPNPFFVSWSRNEKRARKIFKRYGLRIDPLADIEALRPVDRALLAIVRALEGLRASSGDQPTLLVLDEPTVFLPAQEVDLLFEFVRQIAAGGSSVLFVSHDLDEVRRITDRITVLRDGRVAGTVSTAETSPASLIQLIIGHTLEDMVPSAVHQASGVPTVVIEVAGLTTAVSAGRFVRATGRRGAGPDRPRRFRLRRCRVRPLRGDHTAGGTVTINGATTRLATMTPHMAMGHKFALVPGDRLRTGSIPTLTASENMSLLILDRHFRGGFLRQGELDRKVRAAMAAYDVRPQRPDLEYGSFSAAISRRQ